MAIAAEQANSDRKVVAVIGDGAMTAGMAFEALNHAGHLKPDLLVILNDNEMSISPNVGALSAHLTKLLSGRFFSSVREGGKRMLSRVPPMLEVARRAEEHVKGMFAPGTLFEELGFNYFGPVDGHDLRRWFRLCATCERSRGRDCCMWSPAKARAIRRPRMNRSAITESVFSTRPAGSNQPGRAEGRAIPRCSGNGCAIWPSGTSV
jgi:hypothetical protein